MIPPSLSCIRTSPTNPPVVTTTLAPGQTTTVTTTTVAAGCCPALTQTLTPTTFPDGTMTFAYDSNTCRTTVVATCSSSDPSFGLYAAIVANSDNYLDYDLTTVSFPGTCVNGAWFMGTPALQVMTLECILTNPPTG